MLKKAAQPLVELARTLTPWSSLRLDGSTNLRLINATVKSFDFDVHDNPEILISLQGHYAIETPAKQISIPAGSAFVVEPGLRHRPANREPCVLLVAGA